jgi:hypothetical protein
MKLGAAGEAITELDLFNADIIGGQLQHEIEALENPY